MKRKLVKQGSSTMMISLPSKWIKANKLDKGSEIDLEEKNNRIVITTEAKSEKLKETIDISGYSPLINRVLMSSYIKGTDELEVKFSSHEEIKKFQKDVINELIGFEIIKQSQNSFLIKDITGIAEQEIEEIVRRIFLILDSMSQELVEALEKKQKLEPVIEIDSSVNKFVNFCLRILNKKGYKDSGKLPQMYSIVSSLEEIGDAYKKLAQEAQKSKLDKEQIEVIKESREFLNMYKEIFFSFKKEKAIELAKKYETIKKKIKSRNKIDFYLFQLIELIIKMNNPLLVMSV